jgi:signal peptidase I
MVVPPHSYFMMGDNRYNSKDSRYWGFVPRGNLRGRPLFVYYSYDTEAGLDFFRAVTEIRWSRLGHWIR